MRLNRLTLGSLVGSVAAVAVLGVGGAALADDPHSTNSATESATQGLQVAPGRGDLRAGHGMHGMLSKILHGEFVMPKAGGGYQTVVFQRGSVESVSTTAITVKSADGFRKTYDIGQDTMVIAGPKGIGSIGEGDRVGVAATQSGNTATAVHVADLSILKSVSEKGGMPQLHR